MWETGDRDHQCHLLSRTLVPIPVGDGRHAQAVMVVDVKDELDPRAVLVDQVERFTRAGQTPVAAVELEFYVTTPEHEWRLRARTHPKVSPTIRAGRSPSASRRWTRFLPSSTTSTVFARSRVFRSTLS